VTRKELFFNKLLEVVFPGIWFAQEEKMFSDGFKMRTVHRRTFLAALSGENNDDEEQT